MRVLVGREGESAPARELCWDGVRPLVVGRSHRADVAIDDPLLSRQHCRLEARAGGIFVVDLGSANGTYVNGVRCAEARLGPGDELRLGGSWLRLLAEEGAAPASRRAAVSSNTPTGELPALQPPSHQGGGDATLRAPKLPGYRIERILGRGSFGTVYLGRELDGGGREVAIKVLPAGPRVQPEVVARFLREIETLRRLDHPNLVRIYDAGEAEECLYLVMEYVRGSTLASLLRGGPLPVERVLAIADQLLAGLAHAHAQGFVHRDIKPENVLLDEQGRVRLCDFGLVKAVSADAGDGLTRPGEGLGSVAYMAPEQVRAAHAADARADVYAVGSTLYHMLTGRKPYSGPVTAQLLRDVVSTPPPPLRELAPGVPAELAAIVERCMAKDPELRWQSVAELRAALQAFAARSHGGPGLVGRPPGLHARTVAGLPAFEPEQERGEREGEPAGAARAGAPGAAAGAGGARGRTVVGVPVFEGEPEEEPGAGGAPGRGRTVFGLPAFEPEQERGEREGEPAGAARAGAPGAAAGAGGARGRTVVGVPVFEGEPEEEPGAGGAPGRGRTVFGLPAFEPEQERGEREGEPAGAARAGAPGAAAGAGGARGRTVVGVPVFEGEPEEEPAAGGAPGRGRTVFGLPAFEPEQERGEREGEPAGAARAGAPGAAAGAGGARGRTVVGVPVFEGEPEEEPGAGGAPGRGRTVFGLPAFEPEQEQPAGGSPVAPAAGQREGAAERRQDAARCDELLFEFAQDVEPAAPPPHGEAERARLRGAATELMPAYAAEADAGGGAPAPPGGAARGRVPTRPPAPSPSFGGQADRLRAARTELMEVPAEAASGAAAAPPGPPAPAPPSRSARTEVMQVPVVPPPAGGVPPSHLAPPPPPPGRPRAAVASGTRPLVAPGAEPGRGSGGSGGRRGWFGRWVARVRGWLRLG